MPAAADTPACVFPEPSQGIISYPDTKGQMRGSRLADPGRSDRAKIGLRLRGDRVYYKGEMKPLPAPNVPGNTEAERFDNAVRTVLTVSKDSLLKAEAKWKRAQAKRKAAKKPS